MTKDNWRRLSKKELADLARRKGIASPTSLSKEQLIGALARLAKKLAARKLTARKLASGMANGKVANGKAADGKTADGKTADGNAADGKAAKKKISHRTRPQVAA